MSIIINNLNKSYGNLNIFNNFNIEFQSNRVTTIMGGSGVGKSTLLNIIANLTDYEADITGVDGDISYIFQTDRLIEHLTVRQNLQYVILSDKNANSKIDKMLEACQILDKAESYPSELSGGQKQRVAIARAFLYPSKIMLLDEAFNSLDLQLKFKLIDLFKDLLQKYNKTVINVTHNIDEALLLSDNIFIFNSNQTYSKHTMQSNKFTRQLDSPDCNQLRTKIYNEILQK